MQVIRRVGLIGDVHAEHEALAFVLTQLRGLGAETLLQVGDIADGPGDLRRAVALLSEHGVLSVRGNHDRWLLASQMRHLPFATPVAEAGPEVLAYLGALPVTRDFLSPRGRVLLCHGLGQNDMACVKPDHFGYDIASNTELQRLIAERVYRFVLNGHTHRAMLRTFGPLSIINAGTLLRDQEKDRSFTFVDFEKGELLRYRHAPGPLSTDLGAWQEEHQELAD